ncbi:MAG: acyltransferase family protein [Rhodomicrobium sp.]
MPIGSRSCSAANTNTYRPDIDGLRAIAVLLVVFYHAGLSATSGGFIGVDIFFVISGYLITGIITRELDDGHFTFANFYGRRIKRICPALFTVLGIAALAALFILTPDDLRLFGRSIISTVFFYSNWLFYNQVNYFDGPAIEKPLLHTWSLAIEEQYYIIWPVVLFLLYRTGRRNALPYLVLALLCLSLAASQIVLEPDQAQAFYLLPYRGWELLLGAYLAIASFPANSRLVANIMGFAGFAAITFAAAAFDTKTPFPGLNALFPCLGAAMLITAGLHRQALSRTILSFQPLRFAGKISYSLYLIHWPLFSFAHIALDGEPTLIQRVAIVALSAMLAALSYWYVETPARRTTFRFPVLAQAALAAAALLALCGGLYDASKGLPWRAPSSVQIAYAAKYPGHHEQDLADCRDDPRPALVHRPCPIGAPARDLQYDFVLWGDSHARHLATAFSDQAKALGLAGLVIWEVRCPPLLNENRVSARCKEANARAQQWLATQTKLKMVFLGAVWKNHAGRGLPQKDGAVFDNARAAQGSAVDLSGLEETLSLLRARGLPVAIVEDVPSFPVDVPNCAARARMFGRPDERCFSFPRRSIEQEGEQASSFLREVSRRFDIPIVETVKAFCEGDTCRTEKDGVIFYEDHGHLNTAGSRYLGTRINIPWPASHALQGGTASLTVSTGER